jgi:hypothetical protein
MPPDAEVQELDTVLHDRPAIPIYNSFNSIDRVKKAALEAAFFI